MLMKFNGDIQEKDKDLIKKVLDRSIIQTRNFLNINDISINISIDEEKTIPDWGVGGAGDHTGIDIYLEDRRQDDWSKHIPRTLFHECHHYVRGTKTKLDERLVDLILSEGLAQHFEVEVDKKEASFFSDFLSDKERLKIKQAFELNFNCKEYDHARWFFGSGEFPFQAGYDLSYFLVDGFIKERKSSASELVDIDSTLFINYLSLK